MKYGMATLFVAVNKVVKLKSKYGVCKSKKRTRRRRFRW